MAEEPAPLENGHIEQPIVDAPDANGDNNTKKSKADKKKEKRQKQKQNRQQRRYSCCWPVVGLAAVLACDADVVCVTAGSSSSTNSNNRQKVQLPNQPMLLQR